LFIFFSFENEKWSVIKKMSVVDGGSEVIGGLETTTAVVGGVCSFVFVLCVSVSSVMKLQLIIIY